MSSNISQKKQEQHAGCSEKMVKIGVLSDTHGMMRKEVLCALKNVDHIIHAGDVGTIEVLDILETIAPVTAVRGNTDSFSGASNLPSSAVVDLAETQLYVLHDPNLLDLDPLCAELSAVITGHTHLPHLHYIEGVLYLNPGSAGPIRYGLQPSVATIKMVNKKLIAEIISL